MSEKRFKQVVNILPPIQCNWTVGLWMERFYKDLAEKKFTGVKCPECEMVYLPPRKFCSKCGVEMKKFVSVKKTGKLVNFTVAHQNVNGTRRDKPVVMGLVKLEGADTAVFGEVREIEPEAVKTGLKVKAVFAAEPAATVGSLSHFAPAGKK